MEKIAKMIVSMVLIGIPLIVFICFVLVAILSGLSAVTQAGLSGIG